MKLSPVVVFAYARADHLYKTLSFLSLNFLADKTDVYIYIDAPKKAENVNSVNSVKDVAYSFLEKESFNSLSIVIRDRNFGLRDNICSALSELFLHHEKLIVLEDDILTNKNFLSYMNFYLNAFRDNENIWHINGWAHQYNGLNNLPDYFLSKEMHCWGWATWKDRWMKYENNPERILREWNWKLRRELNLEDKFPFFSQVIGNYIGKNKTWAIFWYAKILENKGLCVTPKNSYVENIGFDGSGEHGDELAFHTDFIKFSDNDLIKEFPKSISYTNIYRENFKDNSYRRRGFILNKYDFLKTRMPLFFWKIIKFIKK